MRWAALATSSSSRQRRAAGRWADLLLRPHRARQAPQGLYLREPLLGVIAAITPFNHPLNQVAHKIAPSIASNNRMVLKPSEKTPLSALLLADILYEAGLPPEMFSVLTGDPKEIADEMLTHADVDLVTFTGGVSVGKYIAARPFTSARCWSSAATTPSSSWKTQTSRRRPPGRHGLVQELRPAMHRNQAHARPGLRGGAVHRAVAREVRAIKYGDPMDPGTDMGTVIDEAAARSFEDKVNDAVAHGARLLYGNIRAGALYSPTVLDRVTGKCRSSSRRPSTGVAGYRFPED